MRYWPKKKKYKESLKQKSWFFEKNKQDWQASGKYD
jgi:hypothetical protein